MNQKIMFIELEEPLEQVPQEFLTPFVLLRIKIT